jgi:hypothetical protein
MHTQQIQTKTNKIKNASTSTKLVLEKFLQNLVPASVAEPVIPQPGTRAGGGAYMQGSFLDGDAVTRTDHFAFSATTSPPLHPLPKNFPNTIRPNPNPVSSTPSALFFAAKYILPRRESIRPGTGGSPPAIGNDRDGAQGAAARVQVPPDRRGARAALPQAQDHRPDQLRGRGHPRDRRLQDRAVGSPRYLTTLIFSLCRLIAPLAARFLLQPALLFVGIWRDFSPFGSGILGFWVSRVVPDQDWVLTNLAVFPIP